MYYEVQSYSCMCVYYIILYICTYFPKKRSDETSPLFISCKVIESWLCMADTLWPYHWKKDNICELPFIA